MKPANGWPAVEVSLEHVNRRLDDMSPKVSAMHDLMMKAQGAKLSGPGAVIVVVFSKLSAFIPTRSEALWKTFCEFCRHTPCHIHSGRKGEPPQSVILRGCH